MGRWEVADAQYISIWGRRVGYIAGALALAAWSSLATPAEAQQPGQPAAAVEPRIAFNIPAQDLNGAILAFADKAGIQVFYDTSRVQGLRGNAVSGTLTPREALGRLLAGTGVTYRFTGPRAVSLEKLPQVNEAAPDAMQIPAVQVEAHAGVPSTALIDNLPPPYAGGLVATGGQLGLLGNRNFMNTPFNQTSYTSKLIQDQQARTLADVLSNDPSVRGEFPGGSGIDQFTIRGFLAGNQDVAFNGLYGIAPTSNGMMAVESIERVEVLKGPNALLNGMAPFGSIGGSINIVPKRAGEEPITLFTPSYYSDTQFGGHIDIGRRSGPFGIRFNGAYRNGDTPIGRQSQETRVTALGFDARGESVRLSLDLGYQFMSTDQQRRPLTVAAGVPVPSPPRASSNYSQPWAFQNNDNIYGAVRGEVDIFENVTAFAAVGGGFFRFESINENQAVRDTLGTITGNPVSIRIREDTVTVETGLRSSVATGFVHHDLALTNTMYWKETGSVFPSAPLVTSNLYNPIFVPKPIFPYVPKAADTPKANDQELSSLAIADTLSVLDKRIQLTVGVRNQNVKRDNFNTATGALTSSYDKSAVTPATGLVLKPLEYLSLYGNYIEGLAQGPSAPVGTANFGEVFPPFVSKQYEAGVKVDFGRLATTLSLFQISQPSSFTNPITNIFTVDGEQRNRGLELTTFGEVTDGVRILGGVTFIDSELTKTQGGLNQGNNGIGVPSVQANLAGEWDLPFAPGFTLSGRVIYTSSQYLNAANTQELPSWTRLDLGVSYAVKTLGTPIIIRANIENVFDASYWANASRGFLGLSTPRTFLLSTTFSF